MLRESEKMLGLPQPQAPLYAPGEGGATPTADSGFPLHFITPGPVQLPTPLTQPGVHSPLHCSEFPPSFEGCGAESELTKASCS